MPLESFRSEFKFAGQNFSVDFRIESIRRKFGFDGVSEKRDFWGDFFITPKKCFKTAPSDLSDASMRGQLRQLPQEPQLLEWFTQIVWVRRAENPDFTAFLFNIHVYGISTYILVDFYGKCMVDTIHWILWDWNVLEESDSAC